MLHETLEKVRSTSPTAYQEMLKSMLSLVLSIPAGFNFDDLEVPSSARSDTIFGAPLTTEGICTITQLIEHIKKPKNIATEGIFRKSGVPSRGARLQALLCSGGTLSINLDLEQAQQQVSIHDVCCLLKRFIADLPAPLLLGDRLGELWQQVQPSLGPSRRLEAVQLLLLLLPAAHRLFFADLVGLFAAVVSQSAANRMTASNLATIFTPILFLPRDVSPTVLAASSPTLTAALSFIIASGPVVMEPPASLLANAGEYLSKLKRRMQAAASTGGPRSLMAAGAASMMSTTALIPSTQFCTPVATPKDYTAMMLEQLAQEVQAMPSSAAAKNHGARRVLKSLKKNADSLKTPLPKLKRDKVQQEMIREQLKRSAKASASKSSSSSSSSSSASSVVSNFGSAIKRKLRIGGGGSGSSHRSSNSSSTSSSFSASNVSSFSNNSTTSFEVGALPARVPMPTMAAASGGSRRKSVSATALPPPQSLPRQPSPAKAKTPTMTPVNGGKRQSMAVGVTSPRPLKKVEEEEDEEKMVVVLEQKPLPTPVKVPETAAAAAEEEESSSSAAAVSSSSAAVAPPAAQSPSPPLLPARSAAVKSSSSSRSLLPPPLPPKPSPRTVSLKRKASVYSLPPLPHTVSAGSRTTSSSNGGGRSISADLQPTTTAYLEEAAEDRFHLNKHHRPAQQRQQQHISTPLKELSNRRKVSSQIEKFESLATAASMIPRLTRSATVSRKPSIPKCAEEDGENEAEAEDDQQYVVLSKITTTTTTTSKKVVEEKLKKVKKCTSAAGGVRRNGSSCSEAGKQNQQNQQQQAKHRRVLRSNTNSPRSRVPVVVVHHPHPQQQQQHQRVSRTGSGSRRRLVPSTPL